MLTKDQILQADDLPVEEVEVPEWGGTVLVRTMTNREQDQLLNKFQRQKHNGSIDIDGLRAKIVQLTLVDDDGELMFTADELVELQKKSARAIDRIFQASQRINAFSDEQIEELASNFTQSESSGTD